MEYIRPKLKLPEHHLHIHPLACWHIGAAQCDMRFIKKIIAHIKADPSARWIYMGDGGECVTKLSVGKVWEQTMSPQHQLDTLVELLTPIADKGLFGIRGNHGNRIDKEVGMQFDKALCTMLKVPYMGVSCFAQFKVYRTVYDTFWHHGIDSGVSMVAKLRKAENFLSFIDADAIFTAHSHVALELDPAVLYSINTQHKGSNPIHTKLRKQFICGSAYDSRPAGYAEDRGYRPLLPAHIRVRFGGRMLHGGFPQKDIQLAGIERSDGTYDIQD